MRDILFRGKLAGNVKFHKAENNGSDWVVGWYCPEPFGSWPLTPAIVQAENAKRGSHCAWEVDPDTVGQYIGMADMDAVTIFEGDLIDIPGSKKKGLPAEVWYNNRTGQYVLRRIGYSELSLDGVEYWGKIVGNVYDNPELRGGKHEEI